LEDILYGGERIGNENRIGIDKGQRADGFGSKAVGVCRGIGVKKGGEDFSV
jgi:hypothetical protein